MKNLELKLWCKNKNEWEKDLWWLGCDMNLYTVIKGQLSTMKKENHVLVEYTGVNDKGNKKIYDGDLVKAKCRKKFKAEYYVDEVVFDNNCWKLKHNKTYMKDNYSFIGVEKICHKFEDPKLAEQVEQNEGLLIKE